MKNDKKDKKDKKMKKDVNLPSGDTMFDVDGEKLVKPSSFDNLKKRWEMLKSAMANSDRAFMNLPVNEAGQGQEQQEAEPEAQEQEQQDDSQGQDVPPMGESQLPQEDGVSQSPEAGQGQPQEQPEGQQPEQRQPEKSALSPEEEQELIQHLKDQGYSDAEIAYIVHDHSPPVATVDDVKAAHEQEVSGQDAEHNGRMNDLEHKLESKKEDMIELENSHKKRMMELEYENAKKEAEMELAHKKKEYEIKLQAAKSKIVRS